MHFHFCPVPWILVAYGAFACLFVIHVTVLSFWWINGICIDLPQYMYSFSLDGASNEIACDFYQAIYPRLQNYMRRTDLAAPSVLVGSLEFHAVRSYFSTNRAV